MRSNLQQFAAAAALFAQLACGVFFAAPWVICHDADANAVIEVAHHNPCDDHDGDATFEADSHDGPHNDTAAPSTCVDEPMASLLIVGRERDRIAAYVAMQPVVVSAVSEPTRITSMCDGTTAPPRKLPQSRRTVLLI